jgi:hypothetical protein
MVAISAFFFAYEVSVIRNEYTALSFNTNLNNEFNNCLHPSRIFISFLFAKKDLNLILLSKKMKTLNI